MANLQQEILSILLKRLMEQALITEAVYEKAVNVVHSKIDMPAFFEDRVRCRKGGETDGCPQD